MLKKILLWFQKDNRRSIRNYILRPKLQLGLATYIVFVTLALMILALVICYQVFAPFVATLIQYTDNAAPHFSQMFYESTLSVLKIILSFTLLYVVLTYMFIIYYSHRVVGPMVAFKNYIGLIISNKAKHDLKLRKHDEFKDVASELSRLAKEINKN